MPGALLLANKLMAGIDFFQSECIGAEQSY